jgi:serine/threonine protein phosphatase 1
MVPKKERRIILIYVTSDLHGISPTRFQQLLDQAGFSQEDYLFVLGDVIDRGEGGIDLLLHLTQMPNAQMILGNHEAMMLSCAFLFQEVTEESAKSLTPRNIAMMQAWVDNGGGPTIQAMNTLTKQEPDLAEGIWDYLRDAPLYDTLRVGRKTYVLTHGGLGNFHPDKDLDRYSPEELLLVRPDISQRYYEHATVIFCHTPTQFYGMEYAGKALRTDTWINIDTGAAAGGSPMLLRLGDEKEFYL